MLDAPLLQHVDHAERWDRMRHMDRQALSAEFVDDAQAPEGPAVRERVAHEI